MLLMHLMTTGGVIIWALRSIRQFGEELTLEIQDPYLIPEGPT